MTHKKTDLDMLKQITTRTFKCTNYTNATFRSYSAGYSMQNRKCIHTVVKVSDEYSDNRYYRMV